MAYTLSLASCCSPPCTVSQASSGVFRSGLAVAVNVVPVVTQRPSSEWVLGQAVRKENKGEGWHRKIQLWRSRLGSIVAVNYGIKEYGTPKPPYDTPTQVNTPPPKNNLSKATGDVPKFWDYSTPKSLSAYSCPNSYGAPKNYGIPAYSAQSAARVAAVDTVESPSGLVQEEVTINAGSREDLLELGGGGGSEGKDGRGGGGGGGGGGGDGSGEGEEKEPQKPMSLSQKLTLVYAALVGVGGLIGFAKSGSNKSLFTGGGAALALYMVYSQLPAHPIFACSVGLGISAVLLGVMYPRFKKSGKFMPSGLVALFSLIMTGGYLHGIVRTSHWGIP